MPILVRAQANVSNTQAKLIKFMQFHGNAFSSLDIVTTEKQLRTKIWYNCTSGVLKLQNKSL